MTMPQYWIQTPVENAKEVVQRYLDANSGTLTGYEGYTVTYDPDCEVVLYGGETLNYDFNTIYFGTWITSTNQNNGFAMIYDNNSQLYTFDLGDINAVPNPGIYPSIIWNYNAISFDSMVGIYFIGYKFNLIAP